VDSFCGHLWLNPTLGMLAYEASFGKKMPLFQSWIEIIEVFLFSNIGN
jgi:hypothetical protein